ncbi:MAG: Na+/H+ antiporter NhaC [Bacilli bacterium]
MKKERRQFEPMQLFGISLIPLAALFVILGFSIIKWDLDPHIPLLMSACVAAAVALFVLRYSWDELQEGISESIGVALPALLILMVIGIVIGAWIISGTVPGLIYYGLEIINPKYFLVSGLFLSAIISIATGSSWTSAGTIGIALIGIATALDYNIGWTAGAVVSGAYFGDKMSPLSDTTNLAPAVAGTDIFKHIRSMMYTTIPALVVAAIVYTVVGFKLAKSGAVDLSQVEATREILNMSFNIGLWVFIPPILVIILILLKMPALPALFVSALIGIAIAIPANNIGINDAMSTMHFGYKSDAGATLVEEGYKAIDTGEVDDDGNAIYDYEKENSKIDSTVVSNVNTLLTRGGLDSMLWTVSLIICAMVFGGIMEAAGLLEAVVNMILKLVFGYTSLVAATIATSAFVNVVAADQYLAIVLPGKMFKKAYTEEGVVKNVKPVEPYCLSRVLETGGTLTSALVPWNTCGATMSGFLGVPVWGTGGYAIYTIFNLVNVLFEILAAAIGFGVVHKNNKELIKETMK